MSACRKRPCGGALLQLHQEAQCQPPARKRRCREEEEMKRKRTAGSCEEKQDPGEDLLRNLKRELRLFSQSGTETRNTVKMKSAAGSGLRSGGEIPSRRPEVKMALIRRTRIQTSVHTAELRESELASICADQNDPRSSETQLSQRLTWVRKTRTTGSTAEVTSRSQTRHKFHVKPRSTAGPLGVVSDQSRTRRKRSERSQDPGSYRGELGESRIQSQSKRRRTETRIRRRRRIHPSVFRGRGQLRLSITSEDGQLVIYIHEARGLMGTTQPSCDSYVTLAVTSDPNNSFTMKTPPVLNTKKPKYNQIFRMCVTDDLAQHRLLVSVFGSVMTSEVKPRPFHPFMVTDPSDRGQLIGCMSFGIGSLLTSSKLVRGWFYILAEEFGRSKHLRVMSQPNQPMRSLQDAPMLCDRMFWKSTAWSWDDTAGTDDDDGGYLLAADLRRTPDSTPDPDLNHVVTTESDRPAGPGLKDLTNHRLTSRQSRSLDSTGGCASSLHANANAARRPPPPDYGGLQQLTVSVARGKDGFGFTICSDCPVRVQAVDSGGPAHQSGLRQGDSVLQLNGLPVETWKCVDLAHAIRSCPSHIVLVVWRGLPELRSGCEALLRPLTHNMTSGRKLLPAPAHSKHGRRRRHGSKVRSSFGALGSLWRDRKENREEEEEEEQEEQEEVTEYSPCTTTLKGTRVTSSQGDNYIILSPVTPGGQLLQPVYHDRNRTIGRLYQTHPSKGQNLLHDSQPGESQRAFTGRTSTLPPPSCTSTSSSSAPPSNYGNYQNCTIVQSHLPCSSYGTYVTLAPKTLIFPVFVQPLDLCSPDRTLLMAEEMVLHQADLLPAKVTVLIYNDLMLFTREDEAGRCNVLQSPLYLNTLQLREVPAAPLQIYFLQSSQGCWRCLFSLEAFSVEQKVRVSLCLHDNIQLQLVAPETEHTHQLSDLPSDFGLLSLQSDLLYPPPALYSSSDPPFLRSSSPYSSFCDTPPCPYSPSSPFSSSTPPSSFSALLPHTSCSPPSKTFITPSQLLPPPPSSANTQRSPVWKERAEEEVEVRQQGEGESASETSESGGGVGRRSLLLTHLHFSTKKEEESDEYEEEAEEGGAEEFTYNYRPAVLRRSLSEGSLLQEPRSPRFLSDSTIHQLTRPATSDLAQDPGPGPGPGPRPPPIDTLRKQLTREGGSLHHMLLLLNNNKDAEFRNLQVRKKTKSLAADVRSRLQFLRQRKNSSCFHGNSLEKALRNNRPSTGEVLRWAENLEALLRNQYGLAVFRHFLRSEFSEENLDFWLAVERFKRTRPLSKMTAKAVKIYDEFISTNAARQVNVDSSVRESTNQSLRLSVNPALFQLAQDQIFGLMETDSYPRFLKSALYTQLANQGAQAATEMSS